MKIIVTGGSGFIGTNLVDYFVAQRFDVINVDIRQPQNPNHNSFYVHCNILDCEKLQEIFESFQPDFVVHLAARTDLLGAAVEDYKVNISGVENLLRLCAQQPTVKRAVFASTKLVFPTDAEVCENYEPEPDTVYGMSKALGEDLIRKNKVFHNWVIARPTSIWGPWSVADHIPYGNFFRLIERRLYFHPASAKAPRYFGFVENSCAQICSLLFSAEDLVERQVFYLSDYDYYDIQEWANEIASEYGVGEVPVIPAVLMRCAAKLGDALIAIGFKNIPISSFRLKNMNADTTGVPVRSMQRVLPSLPCTRKEGVSKTVAWFRDCWASNDNGK